MKILEFINQLSSTDAYIKTIYMDGGCYKFALLLREMYPWGEIVINKDKNHVAFRIRRTTYDINGVVKGDFFSLSEDDVKLAESWSFYNRAFLSLGNCSVCDEPIIIQPKI